MDTTQQPVELFFPGHNVSLIGSLVEGRPDGASVRLSPPLPSPEHLPPGISLFIAFPSGAMVLQTPACVLGYRTGVITVQYSGPGRLVQRRRQERFPCSLAVNYRAIRNGVAHGAWKHATTEDISEGGLGLIVEGHVQFPPMVEMHVAIPGQAGWVDPNRPHGMEEGLFRGSEPSGLVRFTGTARHGKFRPDGTTFIGVKFTAVQPVSRLRLMRFLETATGELSVEFQAAA